MAVRDIVKMGDSRLLDIAEEVPEEAFGSKELEELLQDMYDTMIALNGAGIAAPQIGVSKRVVIFGYDDNNGYEGAPEVPPTVLINPEITPLTEDIEEQWEGCLSVPGMRGVVPRYTKIRYRGRGIDGEVIEREADGFHARVVQHEADHLDGILYPFRILDLGNFGFADAFDNDPAYASEEEKE